MNSRVSGQCLYTILNYYLAPRTYVAKIIKHYIHTKKYKQLLYLSFKKTGKKVQKYLCVCIRMTKIKVT